MQSLQTYERNTTDLFYCKSLSQTRDANRNLNRENGARRARYPFFFRTHTQSEAERAAQILASARATNTSPQTARVAQKARQTKQTRGAHQDAAAYAFFFDTPTVFPRRPVVFVC